MSSPLECWSSRASTEEDMVEQVLMTPQQSSSSESILDTSFGTSVKDSSAMQKRLRKLKCNVSEAISSFKNSLNLERESGEKFERVETGRKFVWSSVVRSLTQLYPGSQLPEKLVSNIRKHYDALPHSWVDGVIIYIWAQSLVSSIKKHYDALPQSYSQAGFEMKDVFLHIRLIEQAAGEENPAMFIQEVEDEVEGCLFKLTFACNSVISLPAMSGALDGGSICCKKIQIFEKKGFTLGIVMLMVESGQEKVFKTRVENALKSAVKRPRPASLKLAFGLCGCQEENMKGKEFGEIEEDFGEQSYRNGMENSSTMKLQLPLSDSSILVSVDEWQTIQSGGEEIGRWLLNSDNVEFNDQLGPNTYKGVYRGKKIGIEKMKGCDKGNSYEFELKRDLLELMTYGHKNILPFSGVCIHDNHGLCVATKLMEGGTIHDLIMKKKRLQTKEITRMAIDIAEGIKFMNDHGVVYRDLNTQRILLDKQGNVCLGDMGIVSACKSAGDAMEYETDGYRWLAPEIIAGDPETVTETWMSNVYSYGMIIWEMVTCEVAYSAYSPVQAAVGIAACGLRPEIPKDCPQILKALMNKCWNNTPSKRPHFSEILSMLMRPGTNSNGATR